MADPERCRLPAPPALVWERADRGVPSAVWRDMAPWWGWLRGVLAQGGTRCAWAREGWGRGGVRIFVFVFWGWGGGRHVCMCLCVYVRMCACMGSQSLHAHVLTLHMCWEAVVSP